MTTPPFAKTEELEQIIVVNLSCSENIFVCMSDNGLSTLDALVHTFLKRNDVKFYYHYVTDEVSGTPKKSQVTQFTQIQVDKLGLLQVEKLGFKPDLDFRATTVL